MKRQSGLVSLYELMNRYRLDLCAFSLMACTMVERECLYIDALKRDLTKEYIAGLSRVVECLSLCMQQADGDRSLVVQLDSFVSILREGKDNRPSVIKANLKQIIVGAEEVLKSRLFMFIPAEQAKYFMNLEQFGQSITMFPDALGDMLEASNCFAAGRGTACVFHSMRVAEHGLRHLASELGVEISDNGKPCPIEYATWERVLIAIENKRLELRKEPKSKEHAEKIIKYAGLASHCSHLKDLWRNPAMHSRGLYSLPESLGAMNRVAEFMNLIAGSVYAPPVNKELAAAIEVMAGMAKELGPYV